MNEEHARPTGGDESGSPWDAADSGPWDAEPAAVEQAGAVEVYLAPARRPHLPGPLGWLTLRFGLDVFAGSLLSRQANLALRFAALLLLVIVSFDVTAWSLLFNSIFHASGDILLVDGWTFLAAVLAVLIASAVFVYERQFLTADTSDVFASPARVLAIAGAVTLRVAILAAAALITAQPVELLIFREPIRQRVHEEAVRREMVSRQKQLDELKEKIGKLALDPAALVAKMAGTPEAKALEMTQKNLQVESARQVALQSQLDRDQSLLARLAADADPANLETAISHLEREIGAQHKRISDLQTKVVQAQAAYEGAEQIIARKEDRKQVQFDDLAKMVVRYVDEVDKNGLEESVRLDLPIADPSIPREQTSFEYTFRGTTAFDQLRVLQELVHGLPPRWPAGLPDERRVEIASTFPVDRLTDAQEKAIVAGARSCPSYPWSRERLVDADPEIDRRIAESCLLQRSYDVAYAIALVIPLLVFAVKFLMPRELKHYFSVHQQAWAGNPEALAFLRGEEKQRGKHRRNPRIAEAARWRTREWPFGRRDASRG